MEKGAHKKGFGPLDDPRFIEEEPLAAVRPRMALPRTTASAPEASEVPQVHEDREVAGAPALSGSLPDRG